MGDFDLRNGPEYDLADDAVWMPIRERLLVGFCSACFAPPPCSTFSRLRSVPGGPGPLRGLSGRGRYGLKHLSIKNAELVRLHNLLATRSAEALAISLRTKGAAILSSLR